MKKGKRKRKKKRSMRKRRRKKRKTTSRLSKLISIPQNSGKLVYHPGSSTVL